jgi:uncharacterized protein YcbX
MMVRLLVSARSAHRCVAVNVDPTTPARDPVVFGTIARRRKPRVGVYATATRPGRLAVRDQVVIAVRPDSGAASTAGQGSR